MEGFKYLKLLHNYCSLIVKLQSKLNFINLLAKWFYLMYHIQAFEFERNECIQMQVQFNGRTSDFQSDREGSIPFTCSIFLWVHSSVGQSNSLLSCRPEVRDLLGSPEEKLVVKYYKLFLCFDLRINNVKIAFQNSIITIVPSLL